MTDLTSETHITFCFPSIDEHKSFYSETFIVDSCFYSEGQEVTIDFQVKGQSDTEKHETPKPHVTGQTFKVNQTSTRYHKTEKVIYNLVTVFLQAI
ncbi:MAG: hypothetical protein F6K53_20180 [Moorea sp. SIO4A1]|uniref:hypothetical protein n=1 Tax=Moorena sp. SIO4A1 TaxID=2607835 RepID=UPI00144B23AC|nr:hypothetical protein [Moorena sp. SIO4A1]NEQ59590.1 hypothetical protein [Moorena sp. SIO4A1]